MDILLNVCLKMTILRERERERVREREKERKKTARYVVELMSQ